MAAAIAVLALVLCVAAPAFAGSVNFETAWRNPLPSGNTLHGICFLPGTDTAIAVGDRGEIRKSTDGGVTWSLLDSGVTYDLKAVDFYDANNGIAVGGWASNPVLRTTDGGATWVPATTSPADSLLSVDFATSSTAYAVGASGVIRKSTDGGDTWTSQTSGVSAWLYSVQFLDGTTGYVVGDSGTILKTINGGTNWTPQTSGVAVNLNSVSFVTSTTGWASGNSSTMLQTTDGGTTWTPQTVPTSGLYINSVTFADANNGIAVCSSGKVLTTSDGGGTWATPETYLSSSGLCVRFRGDGSTTNACSVGLYGLTITTANAGADWTLRSSLFSNGILDIDFLDQAHGWLLDDVGHVRRTSDGGVTWGAPVEVDLYSYFKAMDFVSPTTGWVVGEGGAVFKTTDGGATWNPQTSNTTCNLWDVRFLDASTGWAVGSYYTPADTNVILKTTDGGTTWVPRSDVAGTTKPIRAIDVLDANTAWAVGQAGILLKTTNGGADWAVNIDHPTAELYGVDFVDANVGWAVGDNGTVLKTADGGATWTPVTVGTTEYLQSVRFADANTGWIVGFNGTVLYTVDGGTTWHSALTTSPSFTSIALTGRNTGWLAGGGGALVEITAPKAMIDTAWPSSVIRGQTVWLVGHGTDTNGHSITGYSWRSSRDGVISSASGFGTASLSVGTHTIYYKVLCSEGIWGPEVATTVVVSLPRAYLSRPYAPTSVSRYSYFTSYGYLKPRHRRGTYPVKLYCYRYQYGKWVLRKTYWAKAYDYRTYTKYSKSIRLPYKGKWKVLAYHPADGHNSATWSTARYVYAR